MILREKTLKKMLQCTVEKHSMQISNSVTNIYPSTEKDNSEKLVKKRALKILIWMDICDLKMKSRFAPPQKCLVKC